MGKAISSTANPIRKNAKRDPASERLDAGRLRWDDLELLLALGRARTLSAAALRLGVNTSTVARRLDAMEASLAVHLFDRTPSGVAATGIAEALLPVAEAMEQAAADALRLVEGRETEPEGAVRLTAPPGIANWLVAPALVELRRRFPKLVVELDASVGYANLTRREADVALRSVRPRSGDLVSVRLGESTFVVAAAPELCERVGRVEHLDTLDWIAWGADLAHLPDALWLATHVSPARVVLRTSSMDAQLQAARAGLGALVVPHLFLGWTGLVPVRFGRALSQRLPTLPSGALWMVGHRALRDVPRVRAVWNFLAEKSRTWRDAATRPLRSPVMTDRSASTRST